MKNIFRLELEISFLNISNTIIHWLWNLNFTICQKKKQEVILDSLYSIRSNSSDIG